jgi:hypothetical protein
MEWTGLPGAALIEEGLRDLAAGRETVAALLVAIGAPRLRRAGLAVPEAGFDDPEHRLYRLLERDGADGAHSRYNALVRTLVSFERAAECVR